MAKKRKRINKKDAEKMVPAIKEFNSLAKKFINLLGMKVQQKERKISVLVSRISKPKSGERRIDVTTVDINKDFLRGKRKKNQKSSEWDADFTQKKGFII